MSTIMSVGLVMLVILVAAGAIAFALAQGNHVPQGMNNPNAGARTLLNTDAAIRRHYRMTEWTTPGSHYVVYDPIQTRHTERHEKTTDTTTVTPGKGRRHVKGVTIDEVADFGW